MKDSQTGRDVPRLHVNACSLPGSLEVNLAALERQQEDMVAARRDHAVMAHLMSTYGGELPDLSRGVRLEPRRYKPGDRVHYRNAHGLRGFGRIISINCRSDPGPQYLVLKEQWPEHESEKEWFYAAELNPDAVEDLREKFDI